MPRKAHPIRVIYTICILCIVHYITIAAGIVSRINRSIISKYLDAKLNDKPFRQMLFVHIFYYMDIFTFGEKVTNHIGHYFHRSYANMV